jgi:hypothetical protein
MPAAILKLEETGNIAILCLSIKNVRISAIGQLQLCKPKRAKSLILKLGIQNVQFNITIN